jgi:hypothetical protein
LCTILLQTFLLLTFFLLPFLHPHSILLMVQAMIILYKSCHVFCIPSVRDTASRAVEQRRW